MSIHDFHSRLMSAAQPQSRFLRALRRMSQTESPLELMHKVEAMEPWQIWAEGEEGPGLAIPNRA